MANKMMRVAGRKEDGTAAALNLNDSGGLKVAPSNQNILIEKLVSTYQVGRYAAAYGVQTEGSTDRARVTPANYKNLSRKTVYVKNNIDVGLRITEFHKHAGEEIVEIVDVEIKMQPGEIGRLSYIEYPELCEPFDGLSILIRTISGEPLPSDGNLEIYWLGGNE